MSTQSILGIFGGFFIALAVFISDAGIGFDGDELSSSVALVQLIAGIGIVLCLVFKQRTWALYFTIAAATILLIAIIDLFRDSGAASILAFVVLLAGVVLALVATLSRRSGKVVGA